MIETHGETKQNAKTRNALHNFTQSLPTRALQSPVPEKARRARAHLANFAIRHFCDPPPQFRRRQPPGGSLFRGAGGRRSKTVFFGVPSACPTCLPTFGISVGSRARARACHNNFAMRVAGDGLTYRRYGRGGPRLRFVSRIEVVDRFVAVGERTDAGKGHEGGGQREKGEGARIIRFSISRARTRQRPVRPARAL